MSLVKKRTRKGGYVLDVKVSFDVNDDNDTTVRSI